MSLGPCCLQGNTLTGTPRGELQKAGSSNGVHVDRYFVKPAAGSVDPKAALLLFYDVFGFSIVSGERRRGRETAGEAGGVQRTAPRRETQTTGD